MTHTNNKHVHYMTHSHVKINKVHFQEQQKYSHFLQTDGGVCLSETRHCGKFTTFIVKLWRLHFVSSAENRRVSTAQTKHKSKNHCQSPVTHVKDNSSHFF